MSTSPRAGATVSSSVHSSASGPPGLRTTTAKSADCVTTTSSRSPRQSSHITADAYDRLAQCRLVRGEAQPHEASSRLAECTAVEHRYPLGPEQSAHEIVARKAGAL